jgi:hypothetical protein
LGELNFNIKKSKIMKVGKVTLDKEQHLSQGEQEEEEERFLEAVEGYKYLGVTIRGGRSTFGEQMQNMEVKSRRLAGVIKRTAAGSCNKAYVGKIAWEVIGRPAVIYGSEVVQITKTELDKLEVVQVGVGKFILGLPECTPGEAVRGELGWWKMEDYVAQRKLGYLNRLERAKTNEWCSIAEKEAKSEEGQRSRWWLEIQSLVKKYDVDMRKVNEEPERWKQHVRGTIAVYVEKEWKRKMMEKESLAIYRLRSDMKAAEYHSGDWESNLLAQARCGQLKIGEVCSRWTREEEPCAMCDMEMETLDHFIAKCPEYDDERGMLMKDLIKCWGRRRIDVWRTKDDPERLAWILGLIGEIPGDHWVAVKEFIRKAWYKRTIIRNNGEANEDEFYELIEEGKDDHAEYCKRW